MGTSNLPGCFYHEGSELIARGKIDGLRKRPFYWDGANPSNQHLKETKLVEVVCESIGDAGSTPAGSTR